MNMACVRRFESPRRPGRAIRWAFAAFLALGLCLSSTAARAEDPGQDEVALKNGGSIRGTVVVFEPGKSVEIVVTGETQPRVVPWSEVEQVQKGKYAPASAPAAAPPSAPAATPAPPAGPKLGDPGVVRAHIDSPVPVTLVHDYDATVPTTESWVDRYGNTVSRDALATVPKRDTLCSSPCDRVIGDSNLRIVGHGFPSSSTFDFKDRTGDVTVHVQPGSNALHYGGIAVTGLGSLAAVAGAIILPLNQRLSTTTDLNTGAKVHLPNPDLRTAGIGLIGGGLAALGGGIAMILFGRTGVTF